MRRLITTLVLALSLVGCGSPTPTGEPVELLTGAVNACYAGGQQPVHKGVLVPDPEYGTRFEDGDQEGPVMWPAGYSGIRLETGEIVVLDRSGNVFAQTGKAYALTDVYPGSDIYVRAKALGAIPVVDCYAWDFEEVAAQRLWSRRTSAA